MKAPRRTLQVAFAVSTLSTAFWVVGLLWERFFRENLFGIAAIATLLTAMLCWFAFRRGRMALSPSLQASELVRRFIPCLAMAYVILAVIVASSVWVLAKLAGLEHRPGDAEFLATLLGLWLPLWAAPAFAAEWSWRRLGSGNAP